MAKIGAKIKLSRKFSGLRWQPPLTALIERKRLFAVLANLHEALGQIGRSNRQQFS
jgi:hypothetical protein